MLLYKPLLFEESKSFCPTSAWVTSPHQCFWYRSNLFSLLGYRVIWLDFPWSWLNRKGIKWQCQRKLLILRSIHTLSMSKTISDTHLWLKLKEKKKEEEAVWQYFYDNKNVKTTLNSWCKSVAHQIRKCFSQWCFRI